MNWFKDNPFLAGIFAVSLIAAGALGFLIFSSFTAYTASSEAYTAAVTKLHALQNKVPFPNDANLKAVQAGLADYSAGIANLRAQLAKMEIPLDEKITPQQFQDGLRTAVNDIRVKAEANNVKLPPNFYFGFDQYQTQVPGEQAAPYLNRQFLVIQSIIVRLVDFKVASIEGVVRKPLPQESGAAPAAQKKAAAAEPVLSRYPFEISFAAEQAKFRVAFNSLLGADQFLIVRSVGIENSSPLAPPKKEGEPAGAAAVPPTSVGGVAPGNDPASLQVILGRETLKISLHLEMLDFAEPVAAKK
ncbi:MAG: hypothetical protein IAE94_02120 [Chthoniobacterales bacterium]|nr:hypothetical protein [Chthoniobacterales bacterium]